MASSEEESSSEIEVTPDMVLQIGKIISNDRK
jgi:preprotein translocase subunit Sec61beta